MPEGVVQRLIRRVGKTDQAFRLGRWTAWYERAIPHAEELYAVYLKERAGEEKPVSSFTKWGRDALPARAFTRLEACTRTRSASIAWAGRYLELFLVHPPAGAPEQAVANCSSARRSSGPSGTGGSAADHRLTATCTAAMTAPARTCGYMSWPMSVLVLAAIASARASCICEVTFRYSPRMAGAARTSLSLASHSPSGAWPAPS